MYDFVIEKLQLINIYIFEILRIFYDMNKTNEITELNVFGKTGEI